MTHEELATATQRIVREIGRGEVSRFDRLVGGRNHQVYRVETERGRVFLKHYHYDPGDSRDRMAAEFAFSAFAWGTGIRCVAEPLAADQLLRLGLFDFVPGRRLHAGDAGELEVEQALAFFASLNEQRSSPLAAALPFAAEACFTSGDHLELIEARVERLRRAASEGLLDADVAAFVVESLVPRWEQVCAASGEPLRALPGSGAPLAGDERCLSPSDFGFHNALRREDGSLVFHDFEHAGWDDPAKTICDFFCQPEVPVDPALWGRFVRGVDAAVGAPTALEERARLLLDPYRIKWACIALNEALPEGRRRRTFSLGSVDAERMRAQLARAAGFVEAVGQLSRLR